MLGDGGEAPRELTRLVEAGQLGRKTGQGFYAWRDGHAQKRSVDVVPQDLGRKLVDALVAEAKSALVDGIVADADLVDAGAIFGAGFAPFRGGPLQYARSTAVG